MSRTTGNSEYPVKSTWISQGCGFTERLFQKKTESEDRWEFQIMLEEFI